MSLAEHLKDLDPPGPRCTISLLPDPVRLELEELLAKRKANGAPVHAFSDLAKALKAELQDDTMILRPETISRHHKGECRCKR